MHEQRPKELNLEAEGLPASAWDLDLPQMPVPVHGCFAASCGRYVYVVGGTSPQEHTRHIQVYDILGRRWLTPIELPWSGRLMVGNWTGNGLAVVYKGACCLYRPEAGQAELESRKLDLLGGFVNAGKALVRNDRLLLLGGSWTDTRTSRNVVELNPADGRERRLAPMNVGRAHHEAVAYGDRVYVFGGRIGDYSDAHLARSVTDTVERYDSRTDSWELLDVRMPLPRMVAAAVRVGTHALLFDGQPRNDALQMSSVWVFDLERECFVPNSWISPYAAWSGGVAYVKDRVYLAGGNQLVYRKNPPPQFIMQHTIVNRLIAFKPPASSESTSAPEIPLHVY